MPISMRARQSFPHRNVVALAGLILAWHTGIAIAATVIGPVPSSVPDADRRIIVAIAEKPDPMLSSGSSPRGYAGLPAYSGSEHTRADAARLAREHGLIEISAWTIEPLGVRCMLYEIPASANREDLLDTLRKDRRVHLAQPQQEFSTLTAQPTNVATESRVSNKAFNDPYVGLQTGFQSISAGQAQRWASGKDVSVALIDTGVDASHPDLAGRIREQRDFVGDAQGNPVQDRHGTEVAGIIAAVANNGLGIVGIAPSARLLSYRACWPETVGASVARCNSFTLALALAAAITSRARVINLSLGGPHDPLLAELLEHAIRQGTIIVGAVPPDAPVPGFPISTPGVIAVGSSGDVLRGELLSTLDAPGHEILTLEPGGSYDYASGSSLATAHVTGAIALLLQVAPKLDEPALLSLLHRSVRHAGGPIDACVAVREASGVADACEENPRTMELPNVSS